jgi:small subunit ribosomal protein S17
VFRSVSIEVEYKDEIADILKRYEDNKLRKQALIGTVVSVKCEKSMIVKVESQSYNYKYNAFKKSVRRIMAHDKDSLSRLGDLVRIVPCRPMSKMKRHKLIDIIRRPNYVELADGTVLSSAGAVDRSATTDRAEQLKRKAERAAKVADLSN